VSISGGKIITAGVTMAIGAKDISPHVTRDDYIDMLKWISKKHVVLWDEADKRGWLVNGISALLHLVRASLDHDSKDDFSSEFLFDPHMMMDSVNHKPNSATKVLIDRGNRGLKIYPGKIERFDEEETKGKRTDSKADELMTQKNKSAYYLFEDLVEQRCSVLELIMEYQKKKAGQNGVRLKANVRKELEGWDFIDLATDYDPNPRVATLNSLGYGWVDFVRSIGAITLFGYGYGDLIQPAGFHGMCHLWRSLPKHKYYLAASVYDMNNIMRKFGNERADPIAPVHGLLWHCPGDLTAPCQCQKQAVRQNFRGASRSHDHDPVQVLYPKGSRLLGLKQIRKPKLESGGAVVFGHSISWRYRWGERGDDLEEYDPASLSPVLERQVRKFNSESSTQEVGLSTASRSSQSPGSTPGIMTGSSSPSYQTHSTSIESMNSSTIALNPVDHELENNSSESNQETASIENTTRTLRHEKRRLGR
jgi:hypothetical protein